ncbi:MAG: AraC family transcriptional regulator [Ferruginibacter sp.]
MKIFIKHMISTACKLFVQAELTNLGIVYNSVHLGEVDVKGIISTSQLNRLRTSLAKYGFELMEDKRIILVEKVKASIIEMVYYTEQRINTKYSYILSERFNLNYNYLAKVFSDREGITIEKYIICQKIERIKELMTYGELNMTEIADKLNYSSVAHLSLQFKKTTGLTPSDFRMLKGNRRRTIEEIGMATDYAISA